MMMRTTTIMVMMMSNNNDDGDSMSLLASPHTSVGVRLSRIHFFANNGEGEVEGMKTNNLSATELI